MKLLRIGLLLGTAAVAACMPRREPPPPQAPAPPPVATPRPAPPPPPPAAADWRALPLTPGGWIYRAEGNGSIALFGPANGGALFAVRCDRASRQVTLVRQAPAAGNIMTVRATEGARSFPISVQTEPLPAAAATLPASERFLDTMVFSRGRFTVEVPGASMLVVPAWPEPARVIEDCRS